MSRFHRKPLLFHLINNSCSKTYPNLTAKPCFQENFAQNIWIFIPLSAHTLKFVYNFPWFSLCFSLFFPLWGVQFLKDYEHRCTYYPIVLFKVAVRDWVFRSMNCNFQQHLLLYTSYYSYYSYHYCIRSALGNKSLWVTSILFFVDVCIYVHT
jgi:hypothetical protein